MVIIRTFFTDGGTPETGLSPTIRIRDLLDNSLVITDATMSEVGDGHYKYDFTIYNIFKNYSIRIDGGSTLSQHDRYKDIKSIKNDIKIILEDTNEIQNKLPTNEIIGGSIKSDKDDEIDAIKLVTDNLPNNGELTDIITHLIEIKGTGWIDESLKVIYDLIAIIAFAPSSDEGEDKEKFNEKMLSKLPRWLRPDTWVSMGIK